MMLKERYLLFLLDWEVLELLILLVIHSLQLYTTALILQQSHTYPVEGLSSQDMKYLVRKLNMLSILMTLCYLR